MGRKTGTSRGIRDCDTSPGRHMYKVCSWSEIWTSSYPDFGRISKNGNDDQTLVGFRLREKGWTRVIYRSTRECRSSHELATLIVVIHSNQTTGEHQNEGGCLRDDQRLHAPTDCLRCLFSSLVKAASSTDSDTCSWILMVSSPSQPHKALGIHLNRVVREPMGSAASRIYN